MTEWWYLNTHVETTDGRALSLFVAFFRLIEGRNEATGQPRFAHSLTWALSDAQGKIYHADSRVDGNAPRMGLERIERGAGSRDPRLNRAMSEILKRDRVPTPDRVFEGRVYVDSERLDLQYGDARFQKNDDGTYHLTLANPRTKIGCDLTFKPERPPILHGDDGRVRGHAGDEMFYYFIPRNAVTGTVTLDGKALALKHGVGWYDHEFGGAIPSTESEATARAKAEAMQKAPDRIDVAWNWVALQLEDGTDLSAYTLQRCADGKILGRHAIVVDSEGRSKKYEQFELSPAAWWRSKRTYYDYPTRWTLKIPDARIELEVAASFPDQELITVISKPAFWEGRCEVTGTRDGNAVTGLAYVERSGFEPIKDLDEFFGAVGEEVRASVKSVLPLEPTRKEAQDLIAAPKREHYLDGVDITQLSNSLIAPIRAIADRGGKAWRSYAALACCDVVGGDSRKFVQWLAMPELMHVGSLIVDDVQDHSSVRRKGPTCHMIYGEPLAINAGTAAYFITQRLLTTEDMSPERKLRLYDLYFEAMRAGHGGQALDLSGLGDLMKQVAESGDAKLLEDRVIATHRLKTGAPAGALARMGAVAGGGSEDQIEGVGRLFEALGLAFQLVDDVLNLRGFKGDLKLSGEDIANGTVTLPVAKAMARLELSDRRWMAKTLASKPQDVKVVASVVEKLERCGAIEACAKDAEELIEDAWRKTEPLLEDSLTKVMLRAFGWYVLQRHY